MINSLVQNRWLFALRGILAIVFGALAFLWPGITALSLVFLFGVYAVFDGILAISAAIRRRESNDRWWLGLLEGIIGIVAGVIAFIYPEETALALLFVIAAWASITGILEIAAAIRLRREIEGEWLLGLTGVVSIILGIIILFNPGAGLVGVIWAIGGYAIVFGILMILLAVRAGQYANRAGSGSARVYGE